MFDRWRLQLSDRNSGPQFLLSVDTLWELKISKKKMEKKKMKTKNNILTIFSILTFTSFILKIKKTHGDKSDCTI